MDGAVRSTLLQNTPGMKRPLRRIRQADKALHDLRAQVFDEILRSCFEEMSAAIAHDIAQPVSSIVLDGQACLRWLKQEEPPKEELSACVERMIGAAFRASATVARIREPFQRKPADLQRTSVNDIIAAAAPLIECRLSLSSVRLELNLAPALPDALADARLLQRILIILIQSRLHLFDNGSNAAIRITVSTRVSTTGDIVIAIADSGPSMPASDLARLFDLSGNADPRHMRLKLATCRGLVEAQGGEMTAANNATHGLIFTFNLPAA